MREGRQEQILARMDTAPDSLAVAPPPRLGVFLLNGFAVTVDGRACPADHWSTLRATHLVQLLSLQPRKRATRDAVIDALWPDLPPNAGGANLRKAVHHARRTLGRADAIAVKDGEVVLWPCGSVSVDVDDFEQAAHQALPQRDADACAAVAERYGVNWLPGVGYEAWAEPVRERLRSLYGELLRASDQWERLARLEPTDEPAHRALMEQALDKGQRVAALQWYARLREALQSELGVAPDAATQALYERCIAGLPVTEPMFVGRAVELARLNGWLLGQGTEPPSTIVLRGPAGIGKSALSREVVAQARNWGWVTVHASAAAMEPTYGVVTALVERLILRDRRCLDRVGDAARRVLAQLTPLAGPAGSLPGPLGRHQVVGAVRHLVIAAASGSPCLLQIDDVDGVEASDAYVLAQLALAGPPVCLLMSARPLLQRTPWAGELTRLQRLGVLQVLDLGPLDASDAERLARQTVPAPVIDAALAQIVVLAEGNPFAVVELSRAAGGRWGGHLPASVADAITQRFCEVGEDALALLRWLAVVGEPLDAVMLEPLALQAGIPALGCVDEALGAGVLTVSEGRYRFCHDLVRQALLAQVPPHRRLAMHRAVAQWMSEFGLSPALVARHWLSAGQPREAAPWLLAAARESMRLAAFADALRLLEPLLQRCPEHPEALRLRAEALDAQGDPATVFAYRLAASVADPVDSHNLQAKAALAQVKLGDPRGALQALEGVHPTSVEGRLCEALAWSGAAALGVADPKIGTAKSAVARQLALETGDTTSLVIASWAQAAAAHARGELHRSVWADLHETSQAPQLALRVFDGHLCITQRFLYGARPYAEVIAFADAIASEGKRLGAARGQAFGTTLRGEAELLAGDLAAARRDLREGARLHRAIGGPVGEALSLQRLAEVALHEGQRQEACALIDEALDIARQTDIGFHLLDRIYGTRLNLHWDRPEAALALLEDASASVRGPLETCPGCRITFAVPAAIAAARGGAIELAQQHEAQCAYLADVVMRLPAWYAAHDEVLGHIEVARASGGAAHRFRAAAERFRQAGHPLDAARCEALASRC